MRIATWNLNKIRSKDVTRGQRHRQCMNVISPDIWVLTESSEDFQPGSAYHLIARTQDAPDREEQGQCWIAIWSKLPAERVEVRADPQRMVAIRVEGVGHGPVLVIGTVLPWSTDAHRPQGFCKALEEQAVEWRRLNAEGTYSGWCVTGDFNQDLKDKSASHYYGSNQGREELKTVLKGLGLSCLTEGKADPVTGLGGKHMSVDHICIGGRL